ncbi:ABC transporter permease [Arenibacterium sp. CAU 1754]
MDALDKKLFRDFQRLWLQALAIAMVLACGVAILLATFGMYGALEDTRDAYYERNRFADVFAQANRVPNGVLQEIQALDGVRAAEARIVKHVIVDIPHRQETVTGRILSLPETGQPRLNLPIVRKGRLPDPFATNEVAVNEPFAIANRLQIGDRFSANLEGQKRELTLTGMLLSPEFIYTIGPGAMMPDNKTYGILWMPERTMAAAFDMVGAFNDVTVKLDPRTNEQAIIRALDDILAPFGGLAAHGRDTQISHSFVDSEIAQLRTMAIVLPPIFFGITAFLVSMVIGRIIALERSEIGLLKAIGYSDVEVCVHYLLLAGLIAVVGTMIGWGAGTWLSRALARLYAQFFDFPYLIYRVSYDAYAISAVLAVLSAAAGAARSALHAARMPPAVAMSPPVPPRFKRTFLDRLMTAMHISQLMLMIFRSLLRWPLRSALTSLGLSLAVAILVASSFFSDSLDKIMDTTFHQSNRQDAMLMFQPDIPETALESVRNLPGVLKAEAFQMQSAVLRNGHLEKDVGIDARRPSSDLARVIDNDGRVVVPPADSIVLSERLAEHLDVRPGDMIEIEFLGGRNETFFLPVAGIVPQYVGLGAYMDYETLNRLLRQAPQITIANLLLDDQHLPDLHRTLKETPKLSGLIMLSEMRRSFQETIRENLIMTTTIYVVVAVLITVGVAYNGARIQLSERARELASLRILGFTRGEVSFILMGESMLLAILAQPLGWALGALIAAVLSEASTSDLYSVPLVLKPSSFAWASLIVLGSALASSLIVRRRLDRLDLVQVMKTRE